MGPDLVPLTTCMWGERVPSVQANVKSGGSSVVWCELQASGALVVCMGQGARGRWARAGCTHQPREVTPCPSCMSDRELLLLKGCRAREVGRQDAIGGPA